MAAQVGDLEAAAAHRHHVALLQPDLRAHRKGVGVVGAGIRPGVEGVDHGSQRPDVVPVLVGRDEVIEAAAALADEGGESRHVVGGVDEQLFTGLAAGEQVGVVRHLGHRDLADDEMLERADVRRATRLDVTRVFGHGHSPLVSREGVGVPPDGFCRANQVSTPARDR